MESSDPVETPIVGKSNLDEDPQGKVVNPTHYRGMVGTLMYLTASRPDLTFVVCIPRVDPTLLNDFEMATNRNGDDVPPLEGGGTFMKRRPEECYDLIENMIAHHNDWDTSVQRSESSSSITSSSDL
nr:retrovirus-related Pol polyprotein from transposon TNT 1-94 [Tanacetum cinerariifolium]